MMIKKDRKLVKTRDVRSHEQRLLDLREAFGQLKQVAIQKNKVNYCSLTKVAEKACTNKIYLTGNKKFSNHEISTKYREIGLHILKFREDFQSEKVKSSKSEKSQSLECQLKEVKASLYQYFLQLETIKLVSENEKTKLKDAENQITLLQARLTQFNSKNINTIDGNPFVDRMIRTIICPDNHLIVNGRYHFDNEKLRHQAWLKSYDELDAALDKPVAKRLYLLVGLPFAGKSTWALNCELQSDRHSIIFDATNLTIFDRESLIHRIKRFKNVRKCCVYFDTSIDLIKLRNSTPTTVDKKLTQTDIKRKINQFQIPDPYIEKWIEEMIVVRD